MKKFLPLFILAALSIATFISFGMNTSASALSLMEGVEAAHGNGVPTALFGSSGIITTIVNALLFLAGALAVIMIIFGGLRYVTSAGNASSVTAAKNTILYAIIGLIITFLAFAAVNFVLNAVTSGISGGQFTTSNQ